jgi:glycogen(starch) synthase
MAYTLFEVSWEVCNKVGGIYTVVRSKAPFAKALAQEYVLIGPMQQQGEFGPLPTPHIWQNVFTNLQKLGITCIYGAWLIPGRPTTVLIDFRSLFDKKNELKYWLWEKYRIDSLSSSFEFDEPMCFGIAAGMLIEEFAKVDPSAIVAQCHEWMTGFALLHLKATMPRVATVFTTHATMLGRTIAGNGRQLYDELEHLNPSEEAYKYHVQDKHSCEVACAREADVFTTVSDITALEAKMILGRQADVVVYNGFSTEKFLTFEETSIRHYHSRELLHEFLAYHFFPYYAFELSKTLICFTSGRYEFGNKGLDVIISALGQINNQLKLERSEQTIVMFFWVIMGKGKPREDVIENKNLYLELRSAVEWQTKQLVHSIILDFLSGHVPGRDDKFTSSFIQGMQDEIRRPRRVGNPPLATHEISSNDPLMHACIQAGLRNREEDRVKVVIYPGYVDGADGLLNLPYYDVTVGAHLGIFPSGYEPWGYTPLESAALGVPAITTDLAGFGRFVQKSAFTKGVMVLQRQGKQYGEIVAALAAQIMAYNAKHRSERVQQGFAAKSIADQCAWQMFIENYANAYALALRRK